MKIPIRRTIHALVPLMLCMPFHAVGDPLDSLSTGKVVAVRIDLNSWGARIGFEAEFPGSDPRLEPLLSVLREVTPGEGHKCANDGTIRFRMEDGSVVGVGLLPGHEPGLYEVRLYDGERFSGVHRVDRTALLAALEGLGLPMDDPAFRE